MIQALEHIVQKTETGGSVKVKDVPIDTLRDLLVSPRSEAPTTPYVHEQRKLEVRTIRHAFRNYMAHDPAYVNPAPPGSNRVAEPKERATSRSHLKTPIRQKSAGKKSTSGPIKKRPHGSIRILARGSP